MESDEHQLKSPLQRNQPRDSKDTLPRSGNILPSKLIRELVRKRNDEDGKPISSVVPGTPKRSSRRVSRLSSRKNTTELIEDADFKEDPTTGQDDGLAGAEVLPTPTK